MTFQDPERIDFFNRDDFDDPINTVCLDALSRLRRFIKSDFSPLQDGDFTYETTVSLSVDDNKIGIERDTTLTMFVATFDSLSNRLMEQSTIPKYFKSIISALVRNGLNDQSHTAGNIVTQLLPTDFALDSHVEKIWEEEANNRKLGTGFSIFRFYLNNDIASVAFMPTPGTKQWNIGYLSERDRVIVHLGAHTYATTDSFFLADPIA